MKNHISIPIFVLVSLFFISRLNGQQTLLFQVYSDSLKSLVEQSKMDEAALLLPLLDSLSATSNSPEIKADLYFYKAFYWLFKRGEVKSFELLTDAAIKYNELGLIRKANLVEAHICINLYFLGRGDECTIRGERLLKEIPIKEKEARSLIHNILAAEYGGHAGDPIKAIYHCRQAIPYFKSIKNNRRLLSLYGILAAHYNGKGNFEEALVFIDSASVFAQKAKNDDQIAFLKIRKSRALINQEKGGEALNLLKEAENYYLSKGSEHGQLSWIYSIQRQYFIAKGNYREAYKFVLLTDSMGQVDRAKENEKALNNLMVKYETEKKEQQIEVQKLVIENEQERSQRIVFGALSALSLLTLIFGFIYFNYRQKQQEKLKQTELGHQKKLLETTVETQEQERKKIARDLHDGIGQQMSGLKMGFQQLAENIGTEVPQEEKLLEKLSAIIHDTSIDVRNLSHQMMPKALSDLGLIPAVEDMLEKSMLNNSISYKFETFGIKNRLPENIEIGLYRIIQELVNNILKHASASEIDIQLMKQSEQLLLIVEDNGAGFDPNLKKKGHGMMNILSRLQAINGTINYECPKVGGTIATIRINKKNS